MSSLSETLVKKVFPYLALPCIPLIASTNAVMTRAAYISVPEGKEKLDPFVLACLRMFQAFACFLFARWYRNEVILKKFTSASSSSGQNSQEEEERPSEENNGKNNNNDSGKNQMHTLDEAASVTNTTNNNSTVITNVIQSLSMEDQQRHKEQILKNPEHFSPALLDISQAWLAGLLTCGNVFLFTVGVKYTDGTTTAAFLATLPALTFIIGYFLGLEKYSHSRAAATVLILSGNVVMNHLWRLIYNTSPDEDQNSKKTRDDTYYMGALLLFISCISSSGYLVLQRPLSKRMSFLDFFVHMFGFAAAFSWICTLFPRENTLTHQLSTGLYATAWGAIFVGGVLQCFFGYILFAFVSNFIGSSVIVALFRASSPILIVAESTLFLNEQLDRYQVYGGILILVGIVFTLVPVFLTATTPTAAQKQDINKSTPENKQESIVVVTPTTVLPVSDK